MMLTLALYMTVVGWGRRIRSAAWRARHAVAHALHWQAGHVVSARDRRNRVWVGFRCRGCGRVTDEYLALPKVLNVGYLASTDTRPDPRDWSP